MKNNAKRWGSGALKVLLGAAAGFAVGVLLAMLLPKRDAARPFSLSRTLVSLGLTLAWACLCGYVSILVHEAGHLVCGLLSGYRFVSYRAGSFILYRRAGRLHRGRYTVAGTAGQCLLAPPGAFGEAYPYVLYNLGGALANFLLGAVCLAAGVLAPGKVWTLLLVLAGALSILIGLPNLIPLKSMTTDGTNLLLARRSETARKAFWVTLAANEQLTEGRRLREMPGEWFDVPPLSPQLDPLTLGLHCAALQRLMDEGRLAEAAAGYRAVLEQGGRLIELQKNEIRCELLLLALLTGDDAAARQLNTPALQKYRKATAGYPSRLCLAYAEALLLDGDAAQAGVRRTAFVQKAAAYPLAGETALYADLLDAADRRAAAQTM